MFGKKADKTVRLANRLDMQTAGVMAVLAIIKFVNVYNEYQVSKSITEGKVIHGETA